MAAQTRDTDTDTDTCVRAARVDLARADHWLRAARRELALGNLADAHDSLEICLRRVMATREALHAVVPDGGLS